MIYSDQDGNLVWRVRNYDQKWYSDRKVIKVDRKAYSDRQVHSDGNGYLSQKVTSSDRKVNSDW